MLIPVKTSSGSYDIVLDRSALKKAGNYLDLDRKVFIVTDNGVPKKYADSLASACRNPFVKVFPQGEKSKNMDTLRSLLEDMVNFDLTRSDCVVAVGGGVVGDLAGLAASVYMRGVDFYNIPTTVLSQVDSSVGGKTAIDFMGLKNIIGSFYPPMRVLIDPDTLKTLPKRQISNGLAESVKMALTCDEELFKVFENGSLSDENIDGIIYRSLLIKKNIVELDERESGLRRVLNFGHTIAHALESADGMNGLLHGECVAVGMLPMCAPDVRKRLKAVLEKLDLPVELPFSTEKIISAVRHDKKVSGNRITVVTVDKIGTYSFKDMELNEYEKMLGQVKVK